MCICFSSPDASRFSSFQREHFPNDQSPPPPRMIASCLPRSLPSALEFWSRERSVPAMFPELALSFQKSGFHSEDHHTCSRILFGGGRKKIQRKIWMLDMEV